MKLIGVILCIVSTTVIGMYYAGKVYERYKMLRNIEDMVLLLKNEIEYTKEGISEVFYYISKKTSGKITDMLLELSDRTKENTGILEEMWDECTYKYMSNTCLENKDIQELAKLGKNMGYLGLDMQSVNFSKYLTFIEDEIKHTKENMDKTAKMYSLMGVISGIGISILLV